MMSMVGVLIIPSSQKEAKTVPGNEKGVKKVGLQVLFNIKVAELDQRSYDALITLLLQ